MHHKQGLLNGTICDFGPMYMLKALSSIACFIVLLFYGPFNAKGQIPNNESNPIQVYGQPGNPKMTVYVWGQAQTGLWSVDVGTDLLEFASIVTTSGLTANRPEQETRLILRLFREDQRDEPIFEQNVEDLFATRSYPDLSDGDILVLKERVRRRFTWRDVSQVLGTVTSTISLVLLIDRLRDNN